MCLDGGAFLFLQDSTQWRLSLQIGTMLRRL